MIKFDDQRVRCQFFYRVHQQFETGMREYDDRSDCIGGVLQARAERNTQQATDNDS